MIAVPGALLALVIAPLQPPIPFLSRSYLVFHSIRAALFSLRAFILSVRSFCMSLLPSIWRSPSLCTGSCTSFSSPLFSLFFLFSCSLFHWRLVFCYVSLCFSRLFLPFCCLMPNVLLPLVQLHVSLSFPLCRVIIILQLPLIFIRLSPCAGAIALYPLLADSWLPIPSHDDATLIFS